MFFAASEWPAWNLCKWAQLNSGKPQVARKCRCRGQPSDAQRLRVDNVTPNSEKIEQQAFDAWKAQPKLAMGPLKQLASYEAVLQMIQAMNSERVRVDHFHCELRSRLARRDGSQHWTYFAKCSQPGSSDIRMTSE